MADQIIVSKVPIYFEVVFFSEDKTFFNCHVKPFHHRYKFAQNKFINGHMLTLLAVDINVLVLL